MKHHSPLQRLVFFLLRIRYSTRAVGASNIPATGGALMVCNHVSYVDTLFLAMSSPRPIRFMADRKFFSKTLLGFILRTFDAIPVSPQKAKEALRTAADCIKSGEIVCIFPEGQLTRTGCLMELKSGFEIIARRAECPILVAHLDGLWGSIYSFEGGRYFLKLPHGWHRKITVSYAAPLTTESATAPLVREKMLEMAEASMRRRIHGSLAVELIRALGGRPFGECMVDPSMSEKPLNSGSILALSTALAGIWRKALPAKRIGVILPPGVAGTITNLGLLFAGRVPVNLNPTMSEAAARASLAAAGIDTVITTGIIRRKVTKFPWPAHVILIEDEKKKLSGATLALHFALAAVLPPRWLASLNGLSNNVTDHEATLLFTSGSSGLPKGVPLTHHNLLTNLRQVGETSFLMEGDRVLSSLPLFHSFGLTIGLFLPLIIRRVIITAPSPLDSDKIAEAAKRGNPTVLLGTPTFLRGYVKRIPPEAFARLRLAASGAEKMPADLAAAWKERFGCEVVEGYGLTEASPVVSFNMAPPEQGLGADSVQIGSCAGSTGRLLPGLAARFLDEGTGEHKPGAQRGLLALRGANLVNGYLDGQNPDKFRGGWYVTGDIARFDDDGFLFIEGRSSRFSKIGGEMVSHIAVEEAIVTALGVAEAGDCVLGLPDPDKGEELILLTTRKVTRDELRQALMKNSVPNLWIPRRVVQLEKLPVLSSGKLDLAGCKAAAEAADVPAA